MKIATRGVWRPLRCFVILACVGVAVLAADNSWMTSLPLEQFRFDDWFTSLTGTESREVKVALPAERAKVPEVQSSINRWTDRSIFYQPSNGWMLDAARSSSKPLSKTDFASAWMTQQSSSSFAAPSRTDYWQPASFSSEFVGTSGPTSPNAPTGTNGTWVRNGFGLWSSSINWAGGVIADGTGAFADFSQLDLNNDAMVVLDTSRTVAFLDIGDFDGTNHYDISPQSGSTLTFDTGAMTHPALSQTVTSAGDTITVSMLFKGDFNINNFTNTNAFNIAGDIASSATNDFQTIHFNSGLTHPGQINVTGQIGNGSTGSVVSVEVEGGRVIFSGNNTYTGSTFVSAGTLLVNGDQSSANGLVQVSGSGSVLGGTGTVGGSVFMFGSTITGDTTTTVGTLTLLGNVLMHTGEGAGGTYLANLSGNTSDLLAIAQKLTLGLDTTLNIVGTADGFTTYTLATFDTLEGTFGTVLNTPAGYNLVYNPTDIELVPVPEPATWIGGALALGAIAFRARRRLRN